ncbi:MAG: sugar phosphorylase [bacterium]|nr:MAG: sugar phosphorylase [bacterium]
MKDSNSKKEQNKPNHQKHYDATHTVHNLEPDYKNPLLKIPSEAHKRMLGRLIFLYGDSVARTYMPELERILQVYYAHKPQKMLEREKNFDPTERFTEKDIILVTYGDLFNSKGESPLATLARLCDTYLKGVINTLHILPFFPYSSDRGFAIIDFETVDPRLGTWKDIDNLEDRYQLMFDGVFNHVSSKSRWFQEFLNGNPDYQDFFISYESRNALSPEHLKKIFRPRTSDILTKFQTINGPRYLWTTFSPDQIDLNYRNPKVLMKVIEILLFYVRHGADIIRLDAVTYLWEQPGTNSANLEQTHHIVKLFRDVLEVVAPTVALVTETNVPHQENIAYFGNGHDEAQMVYNFALPTLVLYSFYKGDVTKLSNWAKGLKKLSNRTTYLNFLDTHDGIGLMAVQSILEKEAIEFIINKAKKHGGLISYRTDEKGNKGPYEIDITWFSALNRENSGEDIAFQVKRFIASRSIALVLQGVPAIYVHGLIGTANDIDAVKISHLKRDINRHVFDSDTFLEKALKDPKSKLFHINWQLGRILSIRTKNRAFHPIGEQRILMISSHVFSVLRISPEKDQRILTLTNVTDKTCPIGIPLSELCTEEIEWNDIISGKEWLAEDGKLNIICEPYDVIWLEPVIEIEKSLD